MAQKQRNIPVFIHVLLAVYLCIMMYLLFIRTWQFVSGVGYMDSVLNRFSPIPFRDFISYATSPIQVWDLLQTPVLNLIWTFLVFIPAGVFLPCYSRKCRKLSHMILALIIISVVIEMLQMFLLAGSFDTTSILMYIAGGMVGFCIWRTPWMQRILTPKQEKIPAA